MKKWRILYVLGIIIAFTAIIAIIIYEMVACSQRKEMERLQNEALNNGTPQIIEQVVPFPEDNVETVIVDPVTGEEETVIVDGGLICPVDFYTLWDECADIYAWLAIPGTTINYPVVQKSGSYEDSNYYVRRDLKGNYSTAGCIYTQHYYNKDFDNDPVTVVYGHHMRDLSMFGILHEYYDEEYVNSHNRIYFYTVRNSYRYRVVAVLDRGSDNVMFKYSGLEDNQGDFESFISDFNNGTFGKGWVEDGFVASSSDHYLLLSTCVRGTNEREIVVAVREEVL